MWYLVSRADDNIIGYNEYTTYGETREYMEEEFDDFNPIAGLDRIDGISAYNTTSGNNEEWLIVGGHEYYEMVVYKSSIPNILIIDNDNDNNLITLIVPKYIMKKWWESKDEFKDIKFDYYYDDCSNLDYWYENLSTADMTTDLYDFCLTQKYLPGVVF